MNLEVHVEELCSQLRRRQVSGSNAAAKRTAEVLRLVVTAQRHTTAAALIEDVKNTGIRLQSAKPNELAVGNIVRRVLHVIREEAQQESMEQKLAGKETSLVDKQKIQGLLSRALKQSISQRNISLANLLDRDLFDTGMAGDGGLGNGGGERASDVADSEAGDAAKRARKRGQWERKGAVIEQVNELIEGLDSVAEDIAEKAIDYVHANEVILTLGRSTTATLFLKRAAEKREFQVVAAEGAPQFGGPLMARDLAEAGIQATVITDSAIFAMMARANKVVVSASALLANGGVLAAAGAHAAALAAKRHAVPFVVLVGLHKLSPLFTSDPIATLNEMRSPGEIVDYDVTCLPLSAGEEDYGSTNIDAINPQFDFIPPELISLLVTDHGAYTPSYIYRLLSEYYSRADYVLSANILGSLAR